MLRPALLPNPKRSADQSARRIHAFQIVTDLAGPIAGAMMGAVVGAIVGVLAGLPGIWLGACFGALAGAAAGRAMVVAGSRSWRHDAELDEEIGVTSGSLGRPSRVEAPRPQR